MYSIGIDIGTSTTEVVISELKINTKLGPSLLPVTEIEKKSVVYRSRIINLDIGGGTLNAAVFCCGELEQAFAMDLGGRLVRIDENGIVVYISQRIAFLLEQYNIVLSVGKKGRFQ